MCSYLILDEKLDTLDRSGSGLRDGGGDTTHWSMLLASRTSCNGLRRRINATKQKNCSSAWIDATVDEWMDLLKKSITNGGIPKTASLFSAIVKDLTTYQEQKKILRREWRVRNGLCFWLLFCRLEGEKVLKGRAQEISLVALGPTNSIRPRQPGQT